MNDQRHDPSTPGQFEQFLAWLRARPMESWGFFIAGLMIGGLFF
jgi:hypothetical protein